MLTSERVSSNSVISYRHYQEEKIKLTGMSGKENCILHTITYC